MSKKVRVAIAGVGNCASALVQGTSYYHRYHSSDDHKKGNENENENDNNNNNNNSSSTRSNISSSNDSTTDGSYLAPPGLIAYNLGGIEPSNIEFVAAFDVVESKVGRDLADAIFASPNNTIKISDVNKTGITVEKGEVLDGVGKHLNERVKISDKSPPNIAQILKDSGAEILINYLPVGSRQATKYYVEQCLDAGVSFINAIPVFIASTPKWQQAFAGKNLACAGDDVMSQLGATVLHKTLVKLFVDRGVKIDETYQLNVGGDMDFYNMLDEERLEDKRISKTSAVAAMVPYPIPMRIGPSDFVGFLDNDKICYINMRGKYFGNVPIELDVKLKVVDAYNSAGVMIDAIRGTKLAIDRGTSGPLESISAYCFKHPPVQMSYSDAKDRFMEFIEGKRER
ncbi:MAG: inositol-3-phosphate synthase [Nitrososphaeraceae archaeon]